jgi:putative DNA primase/helicase
MVGVPGHPFKLKMGAATWTIEEIRRMSEATVLRERSEFSPDPAQGNENEQDPDQTKNYPNNGFRSKFVLSCLEANEDGDTRIYKKLHRSRFVYDHQAGTMFKFGPHAWGEDLLNEATEAVEGVIDVYGIEAQRQAWQRTQAEKSGQTAKAEKHQKTETELINRIRVLQSLNRKKNILELSRIGADGLGITGQEWDRDPWLIALKNGVINLRDGTFRPGRPEDFIKTVAPVEWQGLEAPAPNLSDFLSGIFDGNQRLVGYLQRLLGYCTTGLTVEHVFAIFYGAGRNGKGTLFEIMAHVLGPYAGPTEAELILKQKMTRQSGGPTSDIIYLRGKRLVWISETDEGRRLNAGKVKWLSGGDTLTGRGNYDRRQISFRPTHKLILLTNHRPHADASDYALFQRLHPVPFELSFVEDPQKPKERKADKGLLEKLKAEGSGIFAWLLRGCLAWQREGLNPPEEIKSARRAYQEEEDLVSQFLSEKCILGTGFEVQAGTIYAAYQKWVEEKGLKAFSGVKFGKEIKGRFDSYKDRNTFYKGVGLL